MRQPPPRPLQGQPVPPDYFGQLYDYVMQLRVKGDRRTTRVRYGPDGAVVSAPFATTELTGSGGGGGVPSVMVAEITADNDDGTYDAEAQFNSNGTWADRTTGTYTFDSGNEGNLYELNGRRGVPIGTQVIVHRVEDDSGGFLWYFDSVDQSYSLYGAGAWVEITGSSGSTYSWKLKDQDASTDASPAVTGTNDATEVDGRTGIPSGSIVWLRWDGDTSPEGFVFTYHGADSGTETNLKRTQASGVTADSSTWDRDSQGSDRGVDLNVIVGNFADPSGDKLYSIYRRLTIDANGHATFVGAENFEVVGCIDDITCGGSGTPPTSGGLVAHWPYEEGTGTTVADISGNGHDGTAVNGMAWTSSAAVGSYAGDFDGSNDEVQVADSSDFSFTGDFSVCLWFKPSVGEADAYLVGTGGDVSGANISGWSISIDASSGFISFVIHDGSDNNYNYNPMSGNMPTSTYTWLCVIRSGTGITVYEDNVSVATGTYSGTVPKNSGGLDHGGNTAGFPFDGALDDVRIYDKALSSSERSDIFNKIA